MKKFILVLLLLLSTSLSAQSISTKLSADQWNDLYPYGIVATYGIDRLILNWSPVNSALATTSFWILKEIVGDELCRRGVWDKNCLIFDKRGPEIADFKSIAVGVFSSLAFDGLIYLFKSTSGYRKQAFIKSKIKLSDSKRLRAYSRLNRFKMAKNEFSREKLVKSNYAIQWRRKK